ncbi:hypothetical protein HDU77_001081 [Chytriomyces hyalinus]|nr:hypothetical protein HDU77_001081 [Chytriomyces hyalinus]
MDEYADDSKEAKALEIVIQTLQNVPDSELFEQLLQQAKELLTTMALLRISNAFDFTSNENLGPHVLEKNEAEVIPATDSAAEDLVIDSVSKVHECLLDSGLNEEADLMLNRISVFWPMNPLRRHHSNLMDQIPAVIGARKRRPSKLRAHLPVTQESVAPQNADSKASVRKTHRLSKMESDRQPAPPVRHFQQGKAASQNTKFQASFNRMEAGKKRIQLQSIESQKARALQQRAKAELTHQNSHPEPDSTELVSFDDLELASEDGSDDIAERPLPLFCRKVKLQPLESILHQKNASKLNHRRAFVLENPPEPNQDQQRNLHVEESLAVNDSSPNLLQSGFVLGNVKPLQQQPSKSRTLQAIQPPKKPFSFVPDFGVSDPFGELRGNHNTFGALKSTRAVPALKKETKRAPQGLEFGLNGQNFQYGLGQQPSAANTYGNLVRELMQNRGGCNARTENGGTNQSIQMKRYPHQRQQQPHPLGNATLFDQSQTNHQFSQQTQQPRPKRPNKDSFVEPMGTPSSILPEFVVYARKRDVIDYTDEEQRFRNVVRLFAKVCPDLNALSPMDRLCM